MNSNIKGTQVVVVGASSGVGRATAAMAAAAGARVLMIARREAVLIQESGRLGAGAGWAVADMTDSASMVQAMSAVAEIDHVVICAAADELKRAVPISELNAEQVERSFDRVRGYINTIQAVLPRLAPRASITLWCGVSAIHPPATGFTVLAAENASIVGLGKALAVELAPVRVNVVMSGLVDTPIHDHDRDALAEWAGVQLPARRLGQPEDLADAALFLMTNSYATAQTFVIDGGLTAI
ncbi:MAG: SDR family oxidoreductase [Nakamurella sp.]